jgi:hypothetical protein
MQNLAHAYLSWKHGKEEVKVKVQFNPTELSFEKSVHFAEIEIPQLNAPLQQFVRGNAERLTVELFFDTTDESEAAGKAKPVTRLTDKVYALTRTVPEDHAPPIVTFYWGKTGFPGHALPDAFGSQRRTSFRGVVESVNQRFTFFSADGVPLRARLTVTMREYIALHDHFPEANPKSPDRTHAHVLEDKETLSSVAVLHYRRPDDWRAIAIENGIEDPRRLDPGTHLSVPRLG